MIISTENINPIEFPSCMKNACFFLEYLILEILFSKYLLKFFRVNCSNKIFLLDKYNN